MLFSGGAAYYTTAYVGNPALDSAGLVFGTDAAVGTANGFVRIPDAPQVNFVSRAFSVEFWI